MFCWAVQGKKILKYWSDNPDPPSPSTTSSPKHTGRYSSDTSTHRAHMPLSVFSGWLQFLRTSLEIPAYTGLTPCPHPPPPQYSLSGLSAIAKAEVPWLLFRLVVLQHFLIFPFVYLLFLDAPILTASTKPRLFGRLVFGWLVVLALHLDGQLEDTGWQQSASCFRCK